MPPINNAKNAKGGTHQGWHPSVFARLVLGPDNGVLIAARGEVAIDAVVAGVEPAAEIPAEVDVVVVVVEDLVVGVEPVDAFGLFAQKVCGSSRESR